MKKLLSLILATAMVLSLIPATFATGTETNEPPENFTIKYDLKTPMTKNSAAGETVKPFKDVFSEVNTNGFYTYNNAIKQNGNTGSGANWLTYIKNEWIRIPKRSSGGRTGSYIRFNLNVPVSGTYTMKANVYKEYAGETLINYKAGDAEWVELGVLTGNSSETADYDVMKGAESASVYIDANKDFVIEFRGTEVNSSSTFGNFYLISGNGNGAALMPYYNGNTTLEVGDTASLKGYKSSDASETAVTYSVTGDAVTVDPDGTITAQKAGTATVTMTATDASITTAKTYSVDITVEDAETDFVSIGVDDNGDGKATVKAAALGDEVTVTATDRSSENMVFRGWVRGSAETGHLVSTDETYKFTAMTNTYLTAIYTEKVEGEANEYYHWNGQFLGNDKTAAETNISPIVGYTFAKSWTEAKTENAITSWIADFTKNNTEYTVTVGNEGFSIFKADGKYDTEVTCTSDNGAVYWYRDGELVDYGTEYKFFIWDDTTITTSSEGHNGAKLMLDKNVKDNTYMVEYDAGDAKLLEVGILFGDTGEIPTVESCKEKMSSQRNINEKGHGQFSATSEYAVARGYLVYQDGSTYRVIYAD